MDNITVSLGPFKNAANEGGTCPKCGGSKPTCCRCPEPERQPIGPSWEAVEIAERLANPAIGKIKIPEWRAMVTEIALALDEAATAALEQERRRIENALTKFGSGSLILYSNGGFELLAEGNAIRMNKKRCVAVGRSLTDLIASIGDKE